ncbi:hypothetical protein Sjap_006324 [Stephania japonica]|uniref:RING-type E3 ubiquitin transferase n=1 Tax=Stephania japonica TaxID=461633 RepID=A0AAP0K5T4_9MAGN
MLQRNLIGNGVPQSLPPIQSQIYRSPTPSSDTSSPVLIISVLGIILTAVLLLSYYIFVIKCWVNCHRIDIVRRFNISLRSRRFEDSLMSYDPATENRGVDESVIRAIPTFRFRRGSGAEKSSYECAVCLNEFQAEERLRVLPTCAHAFHIDCIDIWLQNNANCPLCRSSISSTTRVHPFHQITAPSCSPQDIQSPLGENFVSSDLDFVVIEMSEDHNSASDHTTRRRPETSQSISPPRKLEKRVLSKKMRKFHHVSSMGDECIDINKKDDQFSIQPIRRSFSMDSSTDRQLLLAVQEIIQQSRQIKGNGPHEGCSSRGHRRIVSFGHCQGSRKTGFPIQYQE